MVHSQESGIYLNLNLLFTYWFQADMNRDSKQWINVYSGTNLEMEDGSNSAATLIQPGTYHPFNRK